MPTRRILRFFAITMIPAESIAIAAGILSENDKAAVRGVNPDGGW
jgi:hypothetical protein